MARRGEQLLHRRALHHLAGVHHHNRIHEVGDHAQVVGDQDDRGAQLLLQPPHQVENLRLYRHVQRGGRLIGDQQLGMAGQRHGDHRALAHAAGKLVRIGLRAACGIGNADQLEHLDRACQRRGARCVAMQPHRFGDLLTHA